MKLLAEYHWTASTPDADRLNAATATNAAVREPDSRRTTLPSTRRQRPKAR